PASVWSCIVMVTPSRSATPQDRVHCFLGQSKPNCENLVLSQLLHEIATLLADQGASGYRIAAYQHASEKIGCLAIPIREVFESDGLAGLIAMPTVGRSIALRIEEFLRSGHIPLLDHLHGDETAERVFSSLPGIGMELSHRIHDQLHVESLPELLAAIDDGRLERVEGIGAKRVRTIRECLRERLRHTETPQERESWRNVSRPSRRTSRSRSSAAVIPAAAVNPAADAVPAAPSVPVSEIIEVDAEYRRLASAGKLPRIAPKRLNPDHDRWLPILHTHRGERHYTALYSNSKRAHQLNTHHDWVVVYRDDPIAEGRWTVITSQFGRLRGYRIVRGREVECEAFYLPIG
ncbi:MAG: helix-hairpin-helix domain-containing protein, partial [Rubripirellula sp.]